MRVTRSATRAAALATDDTTVVATEVTVTKTTKRKAPAKTTARKKAVFKQPLAHGFDESQVDTEDIDTVRKPRWITALGCLRYSDLFASGEPFSAPPVTCVTDRLCNWCCVDRVLTLRV